ncbi:MAG TPA: hypothetical protein VIL34_08335 [Actinopolymorphaceae bacterium]
MQKSLSVENVDDSEARRGTDARLAVGRCHGSLAAGGRPHRPCDVLPSDDPSDAICYLVPAGTYRWTPP